MVFLEVLVLGNWCVGKTSVIRQYVEKTFDDPYRATLVNNFTSKRVEVNGKSATLHIWDIVGNKALGELSSMKFDCCVLVYDVTAPISLAALEQWKDDFLKAFQPDNPDEFPFVILGNKMDELKDDAMPVKESWDLPHFYLSAKTAINVEESFETILQLAMEYKLSTSDLSSFEEPQEFDDDDEKFTATKSSKKKLCCCCNIF